MGLIYTIWLGLKQRLVFKTHEGKMRKVMTLAVLLFFTRTVGLTQTITGNQGTNPSGNSKKLAVRLISNRLKDQIFIINKDKDSGKLTKAQADDLRKQVLVIRKQELDFMKKTVRKN